MLHLLYSHLPPTPHLLAVHKIFLPISFNSHHFPRCQPGHIVRLAVGFLFLPPPLIWSSLSHLYIPSQFVIVFPISSLFSRCSLFTPDSSFPLLRFLVSPLYTNPTPLKLLPTSLRGQPGHIVRLATLTALCPRFLCSPLSPPSFFSIYFLPLLPPFSSASPLLRPYCLSRCLPKVARPNVAAPFVAIAQSGRLPPCPPFSQLSSGVKDAMVECTRLKNVIFDKNMQKGRLKQHTKAKGETGNHPLKVPRQQKRAPVMSERQPLCQRRSTNIERRWLW